jgi:protein-S-isoprenylcysteine O-methyltransferase Ste14
MCQQWLLVFGHLLELAGFLFIAFELRNLFRRIPTQDWIFSMGVVLVVVGMLGQTAGGWVGRIPLDFFKSCY